MDKEKIKNIIDFNNIKELVNKNIVGIDIKEDYLVDFEGNYIVYLSPLNVKLIEKIKDLETRIKTLEEKIK